MPTDEQAPEDRATSKHALFSGDALRSLIILAAATLTGHGLADAAVFAVGVEIFKEEWKRARDGR